MPEALPIVCSAHHASDDFGEYSGRTALTLEQRTRFSDFGTAGTVPREGLVQPMIGTRSRGVVDLNRDPNSPTLFPKKDFGKPTPNEIWKPGQELTEAERVEVLGTVYHAYHDALMQKVREFKRPGVVVAWDNTAHYSIGKNEAGKDTMMQPFILSNKGIEGSAEAASGETTSCDPRFLEEFAIELRKSLKKFGLPDEVFLNLVYKGGYIGEHYNTKRHPELNVGREVQSFQIEYDTLLTHNQETLEADHAAIEKVRIAVEQALFNAYANLLTWNIGVDTAKKK